MMTERVESRATFDASQAAEEVVRCHLPFGDKDDPMLPTTEPEGRWLLPPVVVAVLSIAMLSVGVALWRWAVGS